MASKRLACSLVVLAAIGAALAGTAATSFMYGFEDPRPALAAAPPRLASPGPRLAHRVVLVIIDGLGLSRSHDLAFLDELRRRGIATSARTHYPSWSRPNYVSILTGVPPEASGIRTNYHPTSIALDTLMDRARAAGLRVASVSDRAMIPPLFIRSLAVPGAVELASVPVPRAERMQLPTGFAWPFDDARYSRDDLPRVLRELVAGDAELVIALTGGVDVEGHAHGAASPEYRAAAVTADRVLAGALAGVDLARDAILVTADHGHSAGGGHGGLEAEVLTVPVIAAGAGIVPGSVARDARLIDLAPTIAALLGIAPPGHGLGRALTEVLVPTQIHGEADRIAANRAVVDAALAADAPTVTAHRALRFAIVGALALGFVALVRIAARRGRLVVDRRVWLGVVPAALGLASVVAVLATRLSPSVIPGRADLTTIVLGYAIVLGGAQLVCANLALRRHPTRLAAACGLAVVAAAPVGLLAGLAWASFPPPFTTMPGPVWLVLVPAVELVAACGTTAAGLVLIVELGRTLVNRARA